MITDEEILMTKGPDVIVATSSSTVLEAAKMMAEANVGSIIIRDGEEVVGIFTERDLLRRVTAHQKDPCSLLVADVMSSPVKSCRLNDDLQQCAKIFADSHIRHLAVIEEGALVGLIGLRDILTIQLRSCKNEVLTLQKDCCG